MISALFTALIARVPKPFKCAKRPHYSYTTKVEDACVWKKERTDLEASIRAFWTVKETRKMWSTEMAVGASSSKPNAIKRNTTGRSEIAVGTT